MPTDKEKGALGNSDAVATIAVKDIEVAKRFYEGKLGLKLVASEGPQVLTYKAGSSQVLVYASQYAGSNKATSATWLVGDELDKVVQALKGKGVAFEHYDLANTTRQGDVHVSGKTRVAWFKDPDGNILSIVNG
jgi:catechol 2,3-dioxygenase-like lactoylglutathione lyase family enzyme